MLKIYNLKDKSRYIEEVATLMQKEWGQKDLNRWFKEFTHNENILYCIK